MQTDLPSPKPVTADGGSDASASPAAKFFKEKNARGKMEQGAAGFARSLEKAQESGRERRPGRAGAAAAGKPANAEKPPAGSAETLGELLGGLSDQQLIQVLMQLNPEELLRLAETVGLDPVALLQGENFPDFIRIEGKAQPDRNRLIQLLERLSELFGSNRLLDAVAEVVGKKRSVGPRAPKFEIADASKSGKLGEARKAGKKPRVVVLDLRKDPPASQEAAEKSNPAKNSSILTMERGAENSEREPALLFRAIHPERAQTPALEGSARTAKAATNFQARFIPEVVKQTGIILKSGGNGEIRLVLKPENLGSVRIRLALSESSLEGRIVVENSSVKELVESSLDNLRNALRLEGYQSNLEVSVGHRRSWSGSEQEQAQPAGWLEKSSEEFEKAVPLYLDMRPDYELINLYA